MTSSCAAWTNYVEQIRPEWMKHLLPVNTPLMAFARLFQKQESGKIIYITSCLASKDEIYRSNRLENGKPLVDLVLTSRELMQLLRLFGIKLESLKPSSPDRLVKGLPNTNHLSSVSGGYLEALHNLFSDLGRAEEKSETQNLRGPKSLKKAELTIDKKTQSWIATSSISEAIETINSVERGKGEFVLLEVMTCPSGCISGGGQINDDSAKPLKNRIKTIYDLNKGSSSLSKEVYDKYKEMLDDLEKVEFNFKEVYI
jgi:iron only hydrogenase large subunit-like protein